MPAPFATGFKRQAHNLTNDSSPNISDRYGQFWKQRHTRTGGKPTIYGLTSPQFTHGSALVVINNIEKAAHRPRLQTGGRVNSNKSRVAAVSFGESATWHFSASLHMTTLQGGNALTHSKRHSRVKCSQGTLIIFINVVYHSNRTTTNSRLPKLIKTCINL